MEFFWDLEAGEVGAAMGIDGGVIDLCPRFGHHDGSDPFAPGRVRQADDGGLDIDDDSGPDEGADPPEIDEL